MIFAAPKQESMLYQKYLVTSSVLARELILGISRNRKDGREEHFESCGGVIYYNLPVSDDTKKLILWIRKALHLNPPDPLASYRIS